MHRVIGIDEAGYGPNLGPLVVGLTSWETSDGEASALWEVFSGFIARTPGIPNRLLVADSKVVLSGRMGFRRLETAVLSFLQLCGHVPCSLRDVVAMLAGPATWDLWQQSPWFEGPGTRIPVEGDADEIRCQADGWRDACADAGLAVPTVAVSTLTASCFNKALERDDNKAAVLSRCSLALLSRYADPDDPCRTTVQADKHGGRNRYHEFLAEAFGDQLVMTRAEGADSSHYQVGSVDVRFEPRSESHFHVALASMVAKYVREIAMMAFNTWWGQRSPGLQPTKGYPVDAKRFLGDVEPLLPMLSVERQVLWRQR